MIGILFIVIVTLFLIAVFALLNFLGADLYPSPKFTCAECEQAEEKHGIYSCKVCTDEITNEPLYCESARRTRKCYKSARKASDVQ